MTVANSAEILDAEAETLVDRLRATLAGRLYSLVEYDTHELNVLYADDATMAFYESREHLLAHFERVHSHVHIDFEQMELFTDTLFPVADRVEYITTALDYMKLVRVYNQENGLFVAIEPDEPVDPVIDAIGDLVLGR